MDKLKRNKLTRQQEREIFKKGPAKRIAEFMELTGLGYAYRRSGKRSDYPGWNESGAKKELDAPIRGQAAEPSKDLRGSYPKGQSCIDKLLLVCFCLRVPARRMVALIAPLLAKRISTTNIVQVATNLDRELAGYHRSRARRLSGLHESVKRRQTTGPIAPDRELKNPYPSNTSDLEKELDRLLASLRWVESDLWNRLKTAGLVEGTLQRSAARQKLKDQSSRHTRA